MSVKIESISERALELGEGPHWDERRQALYFVGIPERTIHRYSTALGHTKTKLERPANFIIPLEGSLNQFVVGSGRDIAVVQWDGTEGSTARVVRTVVSVEAHAPVATGFNDGKADPRGRLYSGTMALEDLSFSDDKYKRQGSLYRIDQNGATPVADQITLANGLAWDAAAGAMYYIDSMEKNIRRYDYDVNTGNISNLTYIFDSEKHNIPGIPDGMTIDTDGNLWVAFFGSSGVYQISPTGELLRTVPIPAPQVTSCTFGGPDLDILFVTTASLDTGSGKPESPSGRTFKITGLGVKGHPNVNVKL